MSNEKTAEKAQVPEKFGIPANLSASRVIRHQDRLKKRRKRLGIA